MTNIINIIFPRQCINCKKIGEYLCKDCKRQIEPHPELCIYCHKYSTDFKTCFDCKSENNNFLEGVLIPFKYNNLIKKLILKLKYQHKKDVTNFIINRLELAILTNQELQRQFKKNKNNTIISYIPSHRYRKYFVKGYNQSELLSLNLSKKININFKKILKKTKHTKSQAKLDRKGRLKNLESAFKITNNKLLGNELIILIDDVTTTGSTLNEAAKIIKHTYPNTKIRGIVIARHYS